jgi:hypothetical protein
MLHTGEFNAFENERKFAHFEFNEVLPISHTRLRLIFRDAGRLQIGVG